LGYPDSACTTLTASNASGGVAPYTYMWSTGSPIPTTTVCPTSNTTYYVTLTDQLGCSVVDSTRVCVIDVRCGNNNEKITLCHSVDDPGVTICVALNAAKAHIRNHPEDRLGTCGAITACGFSPPSAKTDEPASYLLESDGGKTWLAAMPNPFADNTAVRFIVPADDKVSLTVFDVTGKQIAKLFEGNVTAGAVNQSSFEGLNYASGIYFLTLTNSQGERFVEKLVLTK
jgi:uncharacterized protein